MRYFFLTMRLFATYKTERQLSVYEHLAGNRKTQWADNQKT